MAELVHVKQVKTKKQHRCFACLERFPAGTEMTIATNRDGGDIYDVYTCQECEDFMREHKDLCFDDQEGVYHEGCVREVKSQYREVLEGGGE